MKENTLETTLQNVTFDYSGARYEATVPDTLDLAEHAVLAINGICGVMDPDREYMPFWNVLFTVGRTPHMTHSSSAGIGCNPKTGQSLPMMRLMCGHEEHMEAELANRAAMLARVQDGLYWDFYDPSRPWRNIYADSGTRYGEGKDEDFCILGHAGIMARAVLSWWELSDDPQMEQMAAELVGGMRRVAVVKDDYAYYPERGGWGEACTYPRSGWLNTDEPQTATDSVEGDICSYYANQIYAAARYYEQSGSEEALDLAARLSRFCMRPQFWGGVPDPDLQHARAQNLAGQVAACLPDPACTSGDELGHWFSHFHARAATLRGLLEYGCVAGDTHILDFVRRAYEFTMTQGIARIGWINCFPVALNLCEGCALGDQVALGIRLSDAGLGDYWDNVDAVVRNHLIEGQLTNADALRKIAAASEEYDFKANLLEGQYTDDDVIARSIGIYAGVSKPDSIEKPWVMHCCTGNGTRGLYYAWEGTLRENGDSTQVNLLLNRAGKSLDIDSHLPYEGKVVLRIKTARRVSVRIPFWVNRRALRVSINDTEAKFDWVGNYIRLENLRAGEKVILEFPVSETTQKYTVNANTDQEQIYTCTFRGSTLVDISPRDTAPTSYPLYEREHMRTDKAPMKTAERFVAEKTILNW